MVNNDLNDVLKQINKKFGAGSIMSLGDSKPVCGNLISTGSLLIDDVLGGGIAKGRITEIYGVESAGKSTLCLQLAAQCQKNGENVAYIDVENAMDPVYAKVLGVDVENLVFSQPTSCEQALEIASMLIQSKKVGLIIVDSVAALVPQAELDGEMGDMTVGLLARLMSKAMRKLTGDLHTSNCAMVFINQLRENISTGFSMGPSETTPGGRALKFFASQRIELRKAEQIKTGDKVVGNKVKIKISKNKIAPPMRTCIVPLMYGEGFSADDEVIDLGIDYGFVEKAGPWFTTHDGVRLQGKDSVKAYYKSNPTKQNELRSKVVEKLFPAGGAEENVVPSDDEIATAVENEIKIDAETGEVIE